MHTQTHRGTHTTTLTEPQELVDASYTSLGIQLHIYMHTYTHRDKRMHARTHTHTEGCIS